MEVKGYIERKTLLYPTGGKGAYCMNHVLGCAHGCRYPCFAYLIKKRYNHVKDYKQWLEPYIVSNTMEILDKEIHRLKDKISYIHLCFATVPFMFGYDEVTDLSLRAIKKINDEGIRVSTLTKGISPSELGSMSKENIYGISLVSLNENFRKEREPYTAPYRDRIKALKDLHNKGYKTWICMEPYPTPNMVKQNLDEILEEVSFVDRIVFGRLNYNSIVEEFPDYEEFYSYISHKINLFCQSNNISYHHK